MVPQEMSFLWLAMKLDFSSLVLGIHSIHIDSNDDTQNALKKGSSESWERFGLLRMCTG